MVIQPLLFPPENLINEPELFFRGIGVQNVLEDKLIIPVGTEVSLETYFNSFSIGKWLEYTNLDNLSLNLIIQGQVEIRAYHAVGTVDDELMNRGIGKYTDEEYIKLVNTKAYSAEKEELDIHVCQDGDTYAIKFQQLHKEGIYYITVKAVTDTVLLGGGYSTEYDESLVNLVKLAVGICTFRREREIIKNINSILSDIISNPKSPLADKLEVYVADNGQTIDINLFNNDKVHIYPNLNLGGSGGFTRTMIEAMIYDKAKDFTHIIFMDDDILLYPAVLEKTYYLLCMLKPEYQKAILGAGMLLINQQFLQQEYGSEYKACVTYIGKAKHKFFDLRNPDSVSANEVINKSNYVGWWYACIPKTVINENNLPMPYFIHYDDVEYGLRNLDNKEIFINGICIWHPAASSTKNPFWITYYDTRNRLITMFSRELGEKDLKKYLKIISKKFILKIIRYEYTEAQLILNALQDFILGPDNFMKKDALALHAELNETKKKYVLPSELGIDKSKIIKKGLQNLKISFLMQLFCNILPPKDTIRAINIRFYNIPYNSRKVFLYNEKLGCGLVLERNIKKFFRLMISFMKATKILKHQYKKQQQDWMAAKPTFTSLPFWEKYLGLKQIKENSL